MRFSSFSLSSQAAVSSVATASNIRVKCFISLTLMFVGGYSVGVDELSSGGRSSRGLFSIGTLSNSRTLVGREKV